MDYLDFLNDIGVHYASQDNPNKHSVVLFFDYGLDDMQPIYDVSNRLRSVIEKKSLGVFDGHETAMDNSEGSLYIYGPNAEALFKEVLPILERTPFLKNAKAVLRFGTLDEDASEIVIEI